jgi:hypothetical protein
MYLGNYHNCSTLVTACTLFTEKNKYLFFEINISQLFQVVDESLRQATAPPDTPPMINSPSAASPSGGGSAGSNKRRRVNIGKQFQTHICYVCDKKLVKLDCIKMHMKNKHPDVVLDQNLVMIMRLICYLCGSRKKGLHYKIYIIIIRT